jgi:hypothetical protein
MPGCRGGVDLARRATLHCARVAELTIVVGSPAPQGACRSASRRCDTHQRSQCAKSSRPPPAPEHSDWSSNHPRAARRHCDPSTTNSHQCASHTRDRQRRQRSARSPRPPPAPEQPDWSSNHPPAGRSSCCPSTTGCHRSGSHRYRRPLRTPQSRWCLVRGDRRRRLRQRSRSRSQRWLRLPLPSARPRPPALPQPRLSRRTGGWPSTANGMAATWCPSECAPRCARCPAPGPAPCPARIGRASVSPTPQVS